MKLIKTLILVILFLPIVSAAIQVQISTDNNTWTTVENATYGGSIDETEMLATAFGLTENTKYYLRAKDATTSWGYVEFTTLGGDPLAALAIAIFVLGINLGFFWLAFREELVRNKYANFVLKRCCMILGIYFLVFNSAIMATIAASANLDVNKEMFLLMEYFGWAGYAAIIFVLFTSITEMIKEYMLDKKEKRTGLE